MPQNNQCYLCAWYEMFQSCKAFPDRIPSEIMTGKHDHTKAYKGDNGIRFKPIDNENNDAENGTA